METQLSVADDESAPGQRDSIGIGIAVVLAAISFLLLLTFPPATPVAALGGLAAAWTRRSGSTRPLAVACMIACVASLVLSLLLVFMLFGAGPVPH